MRLPMIAPAAGCCLVSLLLGTPLSAQQQMADPDFRVSVERPAYERDGPTVAIDEAHSNFHTAADRYKPFADLLAADGYRVVGWTDPFDAAALAAIDVLVVSNARNLEALRAGDLSQSAFTEDECDAVRDWVRDGGSLLLIADHAPFGSAAESLGQRFGITMGKGWAFDLAPTGGITTQLDFSRENGLLGEHIILRGRDSSEIVTNIRAFTGQSLGVPAGAIVLLRLSSTAREASTPADLDAENAAVRGADTVQFGSHSSPVAGHAQGLAMRFGKGRVVAMGEAGMFSAQLVRFADGREMRFGMNVPGNDNRQFALSVLHWLSGLMDEGFQGRFVYEAEGSDDIREAIDRAVARMNFFIRPIARVRLRNANPLARSIVIERRDRTVLVYFDDDPPVRAPETGEVVPWTRADGERMRVRMAWEGGELHQSFIAEDGRRDNVFALQPDGTMLLTVTITSDRLPRPLVYRLRYRRE